MLRNLAAARELLESKDELKGLILKLVEAEEKHTKALQEHSKEVRELNKNLRELLRKME